MILRWWRSRSAGLVAEYVGDPMTFEEMQAALEAAEVREFDDQLVDALLRKGLADGRLVLPGAEGRWFFRAASLRYQKPEQGVSWVHNWRDGGSKVWTPAGCFRVETA